MKRNLLLSCGLLGLLLFSACAVTPLAPTATPASQEALQPTFTATTGVTTTAAVTATTAITIAITPTSTLTTTTALSPTTGIADTTASTPVTATAALTLTPVLTTTSPVTTASTTAGAATPVPQGQGTTIAAILAARPDFATLNAAVAAVQLNAELSGDTPYTLFAPTEDAFAALPAGTLDALLASPSALAAVIQNHLLIEEVSSARLVRLGGVLTALGQTLPVTLTATGVVQVGEATVVEADIEATNGVIHAIDTVLLPTDLAITPTVGITSAAAQVTATQAVTTVQIISSVAPTATLADVISTTDELSQLETALGAAGLFQALQLPGQLTLFAPTNAAFEALPANQLQTLLNNTTALADVMQYHLVADTVLAADLVRLGQALSTSSQPLQITVTDDGVVQVNNARIVQADIVTTNGVIHIIDAVLTPPGE